MVAKYGDKSVYFDLEDLGNTTGQWDLYGSDAPSPYNSLQVCVFLGSFHLLGLYWGFLFLNSILVIWYSNHDLSRISLET